MGKFRSRWFPQPESLDADPQGALITWSQNGEDVRLARALHDVTPGRYVEVGGCDPEDLSITRFFYGQGWSGVVVEAVPQLAAAFARRRPRDRIVPVAAGAFRGKTVLHVIHGTGLSTSVKAIAQDSVSRGFRREDLEVEVLPLSDILRDEVDLPIHFMVIDAEGSEADVIRGLDLDATRPWILVIEAIHPTSSEPTHSSWEQNLLAKGYQFVVSDSINRFYVADEHAERAEALVAPPSALDRFTSIYYVRLQELESYMSLVERGGFALE